MLFDEPELENLKRLLSSTDASNTRLGLELLKQHPENAIRCVGELAVLSQLNPDYGLDEAIENQKIAKVIFNSHIDKKIRTLHIQQLTVFQSVENYSTIRWAEFLTQLLLFEKNLDLYEPCLLAAPGLISHYKELVYYLRDSHKKPLKAIPYLYKLMEQLPNDGNVKTSFIDTMINDFFIRGQYYEHIPKVIETLYELIKIYPSYAYQYHYLAGIVYNVHLEDMEKGKEEYNKCLALDPNHSGALNNMANIVFKFDNNKKEALKLAKKAVKYEGNSEHNLDTLAYIQFKGFNRLAEAEVLFRKIMTITKKHHASLTGLGEVLEAKGEYEEALLFYEKGLKLRPKSEFKLTKIADLLYLKLNKGTEALPYYEKIIKHYPKNEHAREMKALIVTE